MQVVNSIVASNTSDDCSVPNVWLPFFILEPGTYAWQVKACNGRKCRPSPWRTFAPMTTP